MKTILPYYLLILGMITFYSCGQQDKKVETKQGEITETNENTNLDQNTTLIKEAPQEKKLTDEKSLAEKLVPIKKNFKRVNEITDWHSITKKEIHETTEGGEVEYYHSANALEKMIVRNYGETFQQLIEYYLEDGQLSFAYEKTWKYNRPLYWDSTMMKETNDDQVFDFDKSEIIEDRSYFEDGKLIHQIKNKDQDSPFTDKYLLEEQNRLTEQFHRIAVLEKEG